VRFDRMAASATSTGTVCFAPTVTTAINSVKVTFPGSFTLAAVSGTSWRVSTSNLAWPSGASGLTNVTTADQVSGQVVRFPLTSGFTPTAGTVYCFNWTDASATQPGSTGSSEQGTVASYSDAGATALIDSANYNTATITNDQITVTATVPQNFSFALGTCSSNTDALGTLSTSSPSTSPTPCTATVNTNASNGWQTWAKDLNQGLKSSSAGNYTIASNCSGSAGTNSTLTNAAEGYNLGVESSQTGGTGTITVATPFIRSSTNYRGGGLCSALQTLASSGGTANNAVLTLYNSASIVGSTPAATDYTDTETVVAAGLF
jgi:hypothetical protein